MLLNIRVGGDDLVLGRELSAFLELKIANSTRESEVAVDTAKVDETTRSGDPVLFGYTAQKKQCQYK